MKKIKRHHHIGMAALFGGISLFIAGISFTPIHGESTADTAPAIVIVDDAKIIDQGVEVSWLEGQAGTSPIAHYIIQRSHDNGEFTEIAQTEADSRSYIDVAGHLGDQYRVIAEDSTAPAIFSEPGLGVSAHESQPGGFHTDLAENQVQPPTPLPNPPADPSIDLPSRPIPQISDESVEAPARLADKFDIAVMGHRYLEVEPLLRDLSRSNLKILSQLSSLSTTNQTSAENECLRQESFLEADRHLLSDINEMDGILAVAACHAIEDIVQ